MCWSRWSASERYQVAIIQPCIMVATQAATAAAASLVFLFISLMWSKTDQLPNCETLQAVYVCTINMRKCSTTSHRPNAWKGIRYPLTEDFFCRCQWMMYAIVIRYLRRKCSPYEQLSISKYWASPSLHHPLSIRQVSMFDNYSLLLDAISSWAVSLESVPFPQVEPDLKLVIEFSRPTDKPPIHSTAPINIHFIIAAYVGHEFVIHYSALLQANTLARTHQKKLCISFRIHYDRFKFQLNTVIDFSTE